MNARGGVLQNQAMPDILENDAKMIQNMTALLQVSPVEYSMRFADSNRPVVAVQHFIRAQIKRPVRITPDRYRGERT